MAHIHYTIDVSCENTEPDHVILAINGKIFEFVGETDTEVEIGSIHAYLVQVGRAFDEKESLFDAMDSIDQSVHDCYAALFDLDGTDELWSESVRALYHDNLVAMDVLFIESIDLKSEFASTDITPIIRETVATLGSNCGLVAHRDPENVKAWTDLGFRKLADSDFYTYAPELLNQGGSDDEAVPHVTWGNRVRRGRRRLDRR